MSAVKGDNEEHEGDKDNQVMSHLQSVLDLTSPVQGGEEGCEEDRERRQGVTDVLSSAAMTNAYYICHNVQVGWNQEY